MSFAVWNTLSAVGDDQFKPGRWVYARLLRVVEPRPTSTNSLLQYFGLSKATHGNPCAQGAWSVAQVTTNHTLLQKTSGLVVIL